MKKLTVRLEDYIYDRLYLVANDNTTSVNKVVASILEKYINEPREINYLKEIDEFWQEYLDQYNSIYDLETLNEIRERHDITAFLHPQDLAYLKRNFGEDFSNIPRFKKLIDFANG